MGLHVSSRDPIWACRRSSCETGSKPDMSRGLRRTARAMVVLSPDSTILGRTAPQRTTRTRGDRTPRGRNLTATRIRGVQAVSRPCHSAPERRPHVWKIQVASIRLDHVTKRFDGHDPAVYDVSLDIADGEIVILVGPSGCGKSTILRMILGTEEITSGVVYLDDERVDNRPAHQRNLATVFRNHALSPRLTALQNIT